MKFRKLSEEAKAVAVADYIKGWKETHPDETFTDDEAHNLCIDSEDDVNYNRDGTLSDWEHEVFEPKESCGEMMLFATWKKGIHEIEITKYYDEDEDKYDEEFSVFRQIEYEEGAWKGDELGTFATLKEAFEYAEDVVEDYGDD